MARTKERMEAIKAKRLAEENPLFRQMPIVDVKMNLRRDIALCQRYIDRAKRNYQTFPQLAMFFMNRAGWESQDFVRETTYDITTYRLIRGHWLDTITKKHIWSPELCLGIIAGLRLPKDEAVRLFGSAAYVFDRSSYDDFVVYDYLITFYVGRPIKQWNELLKMRRMKQIGE